MNLQPNQRKILETLKLNPFISQQELADIIGLSRSATANLISKLTEDGYILDKAYVLNEHKDKLIICIGGANIDIKATLKEEVAMENSNPVTTLTSMGGVVRNVAENLGRLSQKVSLVTLLGRDLHAQSIIDYSKKYMILSEVAQLDNMNTGTYTALLDKNGELVVGFADMEICELMDKTWLEQRQIHLQTANIIVADCNISKCAFEYLVEFCNYNNIKLIIIGVSSPKTSRLPDNLNGVYMSIFNRDESQAYFQTNETDIISLTKMWLKNGVSYSIVTNGTKGVAYGSNDGNGAPSVKEKSIIKASKVVDATGAGDSFSGGVIYAINQDYSLDDAISFGLINSSKTVQCRESVRTDLTENKLIEEMENSK